MVDQHARSFAHAIHPISFAVAKPEVSAGWSDRRSTDQQPRTHELSADGGIAKGLRSRVSRSAIPHSGHSSLQMDFAVTDSPGDHHLIGILIHDSLIGPVTCPEGEVSVTVDQPGNDRSLRKLEPFVRLCRRFNRCGWADSRNQVSIDEHGSVFANYRAVTIDEQAGSNETFHRSESPERMLFLL
jgi:hypothetical protein